jgi:hypothetical protein
MELATLMDSKGEKLIFNKDSHVDGHNPSNVDCKVIIELKSRWVAPILPR